MAHRVAVAIVDGVNAFEFAVACEVFGIVRPELGVDWYDFAMCAPNRRARANGGLELGTPHDLDVLATADTVIVPSGEPDGSAPTALLDALRAAHANGARMLSFCSGAFSLAEAGLLDGRRATTHWHYTAQFRRRFPMVDLDPNVLFVDDGDVLTSAGTAAGIDLSLHVVRCDYGADVARAVARRMVVPPHRDGGQAQYIDGPRAPRVEGNGLPAVLDHARAHLGEELTVADLAARAMMSERTFARRFREEVGTTPFRWLVGERLLSATELLETTDWDVERIARATGFGTATNLREHFRRARKTTPSAYRRAFRGEPTGAG